MIINSNILHIFVLFVQQKTSNILKHSFAKKVIINYYTTPLKITF